MNDIGITRDMELTEFAVEGMTCASCVLHVERALERIPGVARVAVNLANERVRIEILRKSPVAVREVRITHHVQISEAVVGREVVGLVAGAVVRGE